MLNFQSVLHPQAAALEDVSNTAPRNPFNTPQYAAAREQCGQVPVAMLLRDGARVTAACMGFIRGRPFARILDVPSAADLPADDADAAGTFWTGMAHLCTEHGITQLDVGSYATRRVTLPQLGTSCTRRRRTEFVLDIATGLPRLSSNHRRNVSRARKLGLTIGRTRDDAALTDHARLMAASMERREQRGEDVPSVRLDPFDRALLACGAAELFQARDGSTALSSILVLRSARGAYYQSAGTTPVGMDHGASQFLISSVADLLRDEGIEEFNIGGADADSPGLQRFKTGFGARAVPLEAGSYMFGSAGTRAVRTAAARAIGAAMLPARFIHWARHT